MTRHNTTPTEAEETRRALEDWLIDNRWPDAYDLSCAVTDFLAARGNNTTHETGPALSDVDIADALRDAETLCRERHPARWTTVVEQRTTCLACKETAIHALRAALSPAPTNEPTPAASEGETNP